jgi:hypothetical protein
MITQPKNKTYKPISLMNIGIKTLNKIFANEFNNTSKISYSIIKLVLFQGAKMT